MRKRIFGAVVVLLLLAGCSGGGEPVGPTDPPPTVPVVVPSMGALDETVAPLPPEKTLEPVPVGSSQELVEQVRVTVLSVKGVTAVPGNPKETGGPGVAVRIRLENLTDKPLSIAEMRAELIDATGYIGGGNSGPPTEAGPVQLLPGQNAVVTKVFLVAEGAGREKVQVVVHWQPSAPAALFEGPVA